MATLNPITIKWLKLISLLPDHSCIQKPLEQQVIALSTAVCQTRDGQPLILEQTFDSCCQVAPFCTEIISVQQRARSALLYLP